MKTGNTRTYAGVLSIPEGRSGPVRVSHDKRPAGTTIETGTLRTSLFGQPSETLTFDKPTVWHALSERGRGVWMTDLPIEQRQHDGLLLRMRGKVLVGGLGLGYAVVALAAKPAVKEIVVVEKNPHVIKLVWPATVRRVKDLFPKRKVKLTCIESNLFDFLTEGQKVVTPGKPEFDWAFFDIWQGDGEIVFHEVVIPLRQLAFGVVRAGNVVTWNEDVMRGQLYMGLETRLLMLSMPEDQRPKFATGPITIDLLTKEGESIYERWAVPFWVWFRDHALKPDGTWEPDLVKLVMKHYVLSYGRPESKNGLIILKQAS